MKRKPLLLAVSAAAFAAASAVPSVAWAQATPKAKIDAEDGTVIILDDRIVLKRVPVTHGDALNKIKLRDVTIQLGARLADGKINSVKIVQEAAATPLAIGFVAGKFKDLGNGCEYTVSGPAQGNAGRTNWTFASLPCTATEVTGTSLSGAWQTGPIVGHRNEAQLTRETCPESDPSTAYGLWGGSGSRYEFTASELLRVSRSQNSIVIEEVAHNGSFENCFTTGGPITLTLCPGGTCPASP